MIKKYFELFGSLNKEYGPDYKPRPQQIKMAKAVYGALVDEENIVVEAGTGTGKSMAYLIPLAKMITNSKNKMRALVSVSTKSLQSQLWNDRTIIERIFGVKVAMIKGRISYPCIWKIRKLGVQLEKCVNEDYELKEGYTQREFHSHKEDCKANCDFTGQCIYKAKREEALNAEIVIANNSLTILDTSLDGKLLGDFDFAVFDEAHELPDNVRKTLSSKVTPKGLEKAAKEGNIISKRLYNSIDRLKRVLERMSRSSSEVREFTAEITEEFEEILPVIEQGTDEKTVAAIQSLNNQIERYNSFVANAREEVTLDRYYSFNSYEINEKVINIESFFEKLDQRFKSIVFTSATILEWNGGLSYFRNFIGNDFPIDRSLNVGTAFNFHKQMKVMAGHGFHKNNENYSRKVAEVIRDLHIKRKANEGIVVLFNSNKVRNETEKLLEGYSVHKQHSGNPGFKESFMKDPEGILLGLKSCWTGIDIKGDKLKYLVIAGLPFEQINWEYDKVAAYLKSRGRNPFMDYSVPNMINTLRQGMGRLIRTSEDTGEVMILDSRILSNKPYIRSVIRAIPTDLKMI